jgi:asparagine synthase (glutamine-hydrolysing)
MSYLPNNILEYTDKTSMAVSLEVREPLLDHKMVEFAANIPFSLKIKNGSMKNILKIAMKDELPRNVLNRKKRGFTPPIINWLNNSISDLESQYFSQKRIKEQKLFDYEYIKKISDDYKNGKTSNYVKIWSMICLQSWLEVFTKKYNFTI